jgi:transposase
MEWPPQSPDLNPIEHYWRHLKKQLKSKKQVYSSISELWEATEEELAIVNKKMCRELIASMPRRVQAVIQAKGGYTKY